MIERMWINQPSTLQPLHHLHGTLVLAEQDTFQTHKVYFLSGAVISQQVPNTALSKGWPEHLHAQPPAREDAQPVYALEVVRDPTVEGAKRFVGVTHPAPDALRRAVEALEKIKAVRVCKESANIWTGADACRKIATEALATLQGAK